MPDNVRKIMRIIKWQVNLGVAGVAVTVVKGKKQEH